MLQIELVYIGHEQNTVHLTLALRQGATVADAIHESGIHDTHCETREMPVGIYGKQVSLGTLLKEGDRVEIYRPLCADPKENRRKRAHLHK